MPKSSAEDGMIDVSFDQPTSISKGWFANLTDRVTNVRQFSNYSFIVTLIFTNDMFILYDRTHLHVITNHDSCQLQFCHYAG